MNVETSAKLQKFALRFLIASVAVSAATGIWTLLARDFDDTGSRTLLTSITISGASLLILANGAAITRRGSSPVPLASAALAAITVPVLITAYWADFDFDYEWLWKLGASMEISAVTSAYVVLMSAFDAPRRFRAVQLLAYPLAITVATTLIVIIWKEWTGAAAWRTFGTLAIALTAVTIASPLLRRLETSSEAGPNATVSFCPRCGKPVAGGTAPVTCGECGASFRVEFGG